MIPECQDAHLCLQRVKGVAEQVEPNARAVIEETLKVVELLVHTMEKVHGRPADPAASKLVRASG